MSDLQSHVHIANLTASCAYIVVNSHAWILCQMHWDICEPEWTQYLNTRVLDYDWYDNIDIENIFFQFLYINIDFSGKV